MRNIFILTLFLLIFILGYQLGNSYSVGSVRFYIQDSGVGGDYLGVDNYRQISDDIYILKLDGTKSKKATIIDMKPLEKY